MGKRDEKSVRFKLLQSKENPQQYSLKRVISFTGHFIVSVGFVAMGVMGKLDWPMFVAYPVGVVTFYLPNWALEMLKVWKGNANG